MNTPEDDAPRAYAVVDLRAAPRVVGRFLSLHEACTYLWSLYEASSYDVFVCVGAGIQQLSDRERQAGFATAITNPAPGSQAPQKDD